MVAAFAGGRDFRLLHADYPSLLQPLGVGNRNAVLPPVSEVPAHAFHTLRGLLATVQVTADILTDLPSVGSAEFDQVICRLQRGVLRLDAVMENLAVTAAAASGRIASLSTPVLLADWIEPLVTRVEPLFERSGKSLRQVLPFPERVVRGDVRRLQTALLNMLINASLYGAEDDVVELGVSAQHDRVEVRVTDHGPGIPWAERERIFEARFRGDPNVGPTYAGLGLGLYVTRVLIELHGGATGVDSTPGGGASFWIRLPSLAH